MKWNKELQCCILNVLLKLTLKVPDLKSLENEFSLNWQIMRYGHFSYQNIIHGEKLANKYIICKQFEKTMLRAYVTYCFINGGNHIF